MNQKLIKIKHFDIILSVYYSSNRPGNLEHLLCGMNYEKASFPKRY